MLWALGYGDHGRVDAKMMSRATAGHAASIGISGALSLACGDLIATTAGWPGRFLCRGRERRGGMAFGPDQYRKPDNFLDYRSRSGHIIQIALVIVALARPVVLFWL